MSAAFSGQTMALRWPAEPRLDHLLDSDADLLVVPADLLGLLLEKQVTFGSFLKQYRAPSKWR